MLYRPGKFEKTGLKLEWCDETLQGFGTLGGLY